MGGKADGIKDAQQKKKIGAQQRLGLGTEGDHLPPLHCFSGLRACHSSSTSPFRKLGPANQWVSP